MKPVGEARPRRQRKIRPRPTGVTAAGCGGSQVGVVVYLGGWSTRSPLAIARIELVFDTRSVTTTLEYRLTCDRCHRQYPKRSSDQVHLGELARQDGWVRDGKRDVCGECRHEASERALLELAEHQARRRGGRR